MLIKNLLPLPSKNFAVHRNYRRFANELKTRFANPTVLIVGAGDGGQGVEVIASDPGISVVNLDIDLKRNCHVIADAHYLPFPDRSIDGVVVHAVLEHVFDPYCCVGEIHRVLKSEGLVYAETPFMCPVHAYERDFTRFTFLGHRRLFRSFTEIDSGIGVGPGTALAWTWEYFWVTFTKRRGLLRKCVRGLSRLSIFWAPLLDPWLSKYPAAYDAAFGFYFIGSKCNRPISDGEILKGYRGGQ